MGCWLGLKWQAMAMEPRHLPELYPWAVSWAKSPGKQPKPPPAFPRACPSWPLQPTRRARCWDRAAWPGGGRSVVWHHGHHQHQLQQVPGSLALVPPYPPPCPSISAVRCRSSGATGWCAGSRSSSAHEMLAAEQTGILPEALFDEMVATVPPGSMGLMLQPYWSPAFATLAPDAKRRHRRIWRHPHAGPLVPCHSGRPGLCPA